MKTLLEICKRINIHPNDFMSRFDVTLLGDKTPEKVIREANCFCRLVDDYIIWADQPEGIKYWLVTWFNCNKRRNNKHENA